MYSLLNPLFSVALYFFIVATFGVVSLSPPHFHSHWLNHYKVLEQSEISNVTNDFKTHYYSQTLDHFNYNPKSFQKFKQRYLINDKYWGGPKNNAPIFVYLGAEAPIDGDVQLVGILDFLAPQFKPLIVFIEHRFYGKSNPAGTLTHAILEGKYRGYFNSAQALADYAEIILHLKKQLKAYHCPVIVFGGSYGGMLATWFRLKYPHVALGALASSAPILMNNKSPYTYVNIADKDFRDTSETCHDTIKKSWAAIDKLGATPKGLSILTEKFNLCSALESSNNLKALLSSKYKSSAQYDAPPSYPVTKMCKAIDGTPKGADVVDQIAAGFKAITSPLKTKKGICYEIGITDTRAIEDNYGWTWQTCTEFLNPTEGATKNTMFEQEAWSIESAIQNCKPYETKSRFNWVTIYYGGEDIKLVLHRFASNIIFYNGLRDPYSGYSVLENLSDTLLAINAPKGSHCVDLLALKSVPAWVVSVHKKEAAIIKDWITKYNADLAALKG